MIEVKFRVWDDISKKMYQWSEIKHIPIEDFKLEHYTLLQYTGMSDSNGVEIHEGDILEQILIDGTKRLYKIWREAGGFVVNIHQDDFHKPVELIQFWDGLSDMQTASFIKKCRVIGNIIENPELIECRTA